ncbi:MAG TPA: hypothetical protein IAC20_04920 [Candidatus Faecisoma merdavium]|uniref:hypothetical protein n=1 Tax=Lactobacillus amylovorus TaxID=1604 RepID=UPI001F8BFD59|nr:hypothetical protein [Lactobacillus amylovorus]MDB6241937.1 hypothetical protein [Lactobacillus amylovorus]HIS90981.1 hypothetical protein [Candidatus Faecisoma merdavium]
MKIKYTSIYAYLIYIIVFLNLGFFNLIMPFEYTGMLLAAVISIITFFIYIFQPVKYKLPGKWYQIYLMLIFCIYIYHFFNLKKTNISSMTLLSAFNNNEGIFLLLLVFPIYEILKGNDKEKFLKNLAILGYLALMIRLIVWGMYNFINIDIAPYMIRGLDWNRMVLGRSFIRVSGTFLDIYTFIYSINAFFKSIYSHHYKISAFIGILFIFLYSVLISQYRMVSLALLSVLILVILKETYNSQRRLLNVLLFIMLIILIMIIGHGIIMNFINSFSLNASTGSSTSTRLNGLPFIEEEWKNSSIWNGFGFSNDNMTYMNMTYWLSDYGFLANLFQFGIIGFLICLVPFIYGIYFSIVSFFKEKNIYVLGFTVYLLITSTTFNPMRNQYISILPFYIAFMLFYKERNKI